jgi:HD-like signal output (HDOD) protein
MLTDVINETPAAAHEIVRKLGAIATLPEITARIIATVEDPKSSASTLHKIIAHDPALVTRILKVVNSAFYGLPGQIASIERAIVLLGLNAVKNIAVAASLGQLFRGVRLCEGFTARDLWTHCIAVGITARHLAHQMRLPLVDEAFLAGMIHDVGMLVSLQLFPDKLSDVCDEARKGAEEFCQIEQRIAGYDHQQLGLALCQQWKFPRSCQLVAGYHHRPTVLAQNNRLLVTLVFVADTLCCAAQKGFHLTGFNQRIEAGGIDGIGLDPLLIEQTRAALPELIESSAGVFA